MRQIVVSTENVFLEFHRHVAGERKVVYEKRVPIRHNNRNFDLWHLLCRAFFLLFYSSLSLAVCRGLEIGEGQYKGMLGDTKASGEFHLHVVAPGHLSGIFKLAPSSSENGQVWGAEVELHLQPDGAWQFQFSDTPRLSANHGLLRRFNTPDGEAYLGSFMNDQMNPPRSSWIGIWLDSEREVAALKPFHRLVPELSVNSGGRFRWWGPNPSGLASTSTRSILKASNGYLWVGTTDGISRFDGRSWKSYDAETAPSLPGWNCRGLAEDDRGNLIVMLKHHGFYRLRGENWEPFECNSELENSIPGGLCRDERGNLWFTTDSIQLCRIDSNDQLTQWTVQEVMPLRPPESLFAPHLRNVVPFGSGVMFASSRGVRPFVQDTDGKSFWIVPRVGDIARIVRGFEDDLWVSSLSIILHYDFAGHVIETFHPRIHTGTIRIAFPSRKGGLWLLGAEGLFFMPNPLEIVHYSQFPTEMSEAVTDAFEDEEGSIWISTSKKGLCQFRPTQTKSLEIPSLSDPFRNALLRPITLATDHNAELLLAAGRGVLRRRHSDWTIPETPADLEHTVVAAGVDENSWWVGLAPFETNRGLSDIVEVPESVPIALEFHGNDVKQTYLLPHSTAIERLTSMIWIDGSGAWLGTNEGVYVCRDGNVSSLNDHLGLPPCSVSALFRDKNKQVWIGTHDLGLYRVSQSMDAVEHYSSDNGILYSDNILVLGDSLHGDLWCGGEGGLYLLNPPGDPSILDVTAGLPLPVHALVEDQLGNVWAGTSTGIYALRSEDIGNLLADSSSTLRWVRFGRMDVLTNPSTESGHFPAAVQAGDGDLYFCMHGEVIHFNPEKLLGTLSNGPNVRITSMGDGERRIWWSREKSPNPGQIKLEPGAGAHLRVDFSTIHFTEPEQVSFRYRLENVSKEWNDLGAQQSVWLFDLAPGNYRFEVEAIDKNLVHSPQAAGLSFEVPPYFYQTWGFQILALAGLMGLIWIGHYRQVRRRLQMAEAKGRLRLEADRQRIAYDMHDEIGACFAQLKILGELVECGRVRGADLNHTISKMISLAREGSQTLREVLWSLKPSQLPGEDMGEFLGATLENLLDGTGIRLNFRYDWRNPVSQMNPRFRREILLISKGIVSNVIRHSKANHFTCTLTGEGRTLRLVWEDDGVGFDPEALKEDSMGMQSMRDRVDELGGLFELKTVPGNGVRIAATFHCEDSFGNLKERTKNDK